MPPRKGQRWKRSRFSKTPVILMCARCPTRFERRHSQHKYCEGCRESAYGQLTSDWLEANKDTRRKQVKAYHENYYAKNRKEKLTKIANYQKTPRGKEVRRKADANTRRRNPEKVAARQMVRCAIVCGVLKKEPCEVCGNPEAEAHHDDYSKPLDVRWLCVADHKAHHRELKRLQRRPNPKL
jgi:hypothetical protein